MAPPTKLQGRAALVNQTVAAPKKSNAASGSNGAGKKMASLSSFQTSLNFSSLPPSASRSNSPATSTATSTSTSDDRKKMPPPPPGVTGKKVASPLKSGATSQETHYRPVGKGKGRADDPVEILSDDEAEQGVQDTTNKYSMWTELYTPTTEADLAPGRQRIARVKAWLQEALHGHPKDYIPPPGGLSQASKDKTRKYKRILLLTGPAGGGKTTTIRVLAKEFGIELVEWGEGIEEWSLGGGIDRESPINKLSSFLQRHAYQSLTLSSQGSSSGSLPRPRILLMTSLPNLTHLPTREAFHDALLQFCKSYSSTSSPLIIVHSDAGSSGWAEESWMDRERGGREGVLEVVGKDVKNGPWATEIEFLSLAPTFMTKAMTKVLDSALTDPTRRPPVSALQLIALTSNGDLRSAINSLQLLCSRNRGDAGKKRKAQTEMGGPKKKGKGSRGGKGAKLDVSDDLRAVLDAVTRREQSLNLFHAIGKVLYNKRLGDPGIEEDDAELVSTIKALPKETLLPPHLSEFDKKKSLTQMESFLPTIPVDASSFSLWIHQNLPTFCDEIEEFAFAVDGFCDADIVKTDDDIWQSSSQAIAYALNLAVRGAQMALPSPVPRRNQKVVKPQFFASYKTQRDNLGLLDAAASYITKKAVTASIKLSERPLLEHDEGVWGGMPTKTVLATELVPMMVKIQSLTSQPLLPASVKALTMPAYTQSARPEQELRAFDVGQDEDEYDEGAGEDGMGTVTEGGGWDEETAEDDEEDGIEEEIEDWD